MKTRILIILTTCLMATTGCATLRDTRVYHEERILSLSGGTEINKGGETGASTTLAFDQRISKRDLFLGFQAHGAWIKDTGLTYPTQLIGMDVSLSYRWQLGPLYIQPKGFFGLGMVSHNTVMSTKPDFLGNFVRNERQQSFLTPEAGGRLDVGFQLGKARLGVYASYTWQCGLYSPTKVTNMSIGREWLTNSPFSAGISLSFDINKGQTHMGGNNVPLVEVLGIYGTRGWEVGTQLIFQRNTGLPWLLGKEEALRGEFVASSHYGIRFTETLGKINRSTTQIGYGLFIHPAGSESVHTFRGMIWLGVGELEASAETRIGEKVSGDFGALQANPKGSLEIAYILRPKDYRQFYATVTAGASYSIIPGTQVGGATTLVAETTQKPWAFYLGLGLGMAL